MKLERHYLFSKLYIIDSSSIWIRSDKVKLLQANTIIFSEQLCAHFLTDWTPFHSTTHSFNPLRSNRKPLATLIMFLIRGN